MAVRKMQLHAGRWHAETFSTCVRPHEGSDFANAGQYFLDNSKDLEFFGRFAVCQMFLDQMMCFSVPQCRVVALTPSQGWDTPTAKKQVRVP